MTVVKNRTKFTKLLLLCKYKVYTSLYKEYTKAIHQATEVAVIQRNLCHDIYFNVIFLQKNNMENSLQLEHFLR